jgi:hypothetical protein
LRNSAIQSTGDIALEKKLALDVIGKLSPDAVKDKIVEIAKFE